MGRQRAGRALWVDRKVSEPKMTMKSMTVGLWGGPVECYALMSMEIRRGTWRQGTGASRHGSGAGR